MAGVFLKLTFSILEKVCAFQLVTNKNGSKRSAAFEAIESF